MFILAARDGQCLLGCCRKDIQTHELLNSLCLSEHNNQCALHQGGGGQFCFTARVGNKWNLQTLKTASYCHQPLPLISEEHKTSSRGEKDIGTSYQPEVEVLALGFWVQASGAWEWGRVAGNFSSIREKAAVPGPGILCPTHKPSVRYWEWGPVCRGITETPIKEVGRSLVNRQQTGLDPHHCTTFCNLIPARLASMFFLFSSIHGSAACFWSAYFFFSCTRGFQEWLMDYE